MSQLLIDAKTTVLTLNVVAGTIDNNIEKVFDFTIAEDVVVNFLKGSPAVVGYDMLQGPWNHRGANRIVRVEGGNQWHETVTDFQRPYLFAYQLNEFQGGELSRLAEFAVAQFFFMPYGPRTLVKHYYGFHPKSPELLSEMHEFASKVWYPWQTTFMEGMKKALGKDPWSA